MTFSDSTLEMYPLDHYHVSLAAVAQTKFEDDSAEALATDVVVWGDVSGWVISTDQTDDPSTALREVVKGSQGGYNLASVKAQRAGSTITMVFVILGSMVLLAVIAVLVVRAVAKHQRYIDVSLAGWFAALLFANFPLRVNMPGAPPIGVWIDYIVLLWVVVIFMTSLAVFVAAWLRYGDPAINYAEPKTEDTPDSTTVLQ